MTTGTQGGGRVEVGKDVHEVVQDGDEGFKFVTVIMMMEELLEGTQNETFQQITKSMPMSSYFLFHHRILRFCNTSRRTYDAVSA